MSTIPSKAFPVKPILPKALPAVGTYDRLVRGFDHDGNEVTGNAIVERNTELPMPWNMDNVYVSSDSGEKRQIKRFLPPIWPTDIICCGLNYRDHAAEVELEIPRTPVLFAKPKSSLAGNGDHIVIPECASAKPEVDYEAELAIVIGETCKDVSEEDALKFVYGYTIANDVSARRWQGLKGGGQWYRSKSFATFGPIGPYITAAALVPNPNDLKITCDLNGVRVQDSNTNQMIQSVQKIISYCSKDTWLMEGTVILTGTPAGVGFSRKPPLYLKTGDVISVSIEGLGSLINTVVDCP
eukprot:CFRG0604T1